jgi:molybdopterin converting factor small subunit
VIEVEVSFFAWQDKVLGKEKQGPAVLPEKVKEGTTFGGLLSHLVRKYPALVGTLVDPATGQLYEYVMVTINGRFLDLVGGQEVRLQAGDRVQFLPFLAGG